jgi:hypothetical protein
MAERKPAKTGTQQSVKSTTGEAAKGFTDEERAAMRERAQEVKAAARRDSRAGQDGRGSDVLAKIAEMPRYATFGFSDKANLGQGAKWPTSFALKKLTAAEEARIGALVKKA